MTIYLHTCPPVCLSIIVCLAGCPCMSVRPPLLSVCLRLSVSLSLHVHLSVCLSVCVYLSARLSIVTCLYFRPFSLLVRTSDRLSVCPLICPYFCPSVCSVMSNFLCVCLCVCHCVSVSLPVCLPLHVFMSNSVYVCL